MTFSQFFLRVPTSEYWSQRLRQLNDAVLQVWRRENNDIYRRVVRRWHTQLDGEIYGQRIRKRGLGRKTRKATRAKEQACA